ncbi:unannotated protein [freshwater metagenome]|uniref:Unannotated protein n=1 Tax=freshwater metagenome TaxID=449393 RepID=A0A6J6JJ01_9ZZZZ
MVLQLAGTPSIPSAVTAKTVSLEAIEPLAVAEVVKEAAHPVPPLAAAVVQAEQLTSTTPVVVELEPVVREATLHLLVQPQPEQMLELVVEELLQQ